MSKEGWEEKEGNDHTQDDNFEDEVSSEESDIRKRHEMARHNLMNGVGVRTGDVLLFCSNTPTAYFLRVGTSSLWNHTGIAIRLKRDEGKEGGKDGEWKNRKCRISIDDEGDLYVMEVNVNPRYDAWTGGTRSGLSLSEYKWCISRYNRIAWRSMKESYRNDTFAMNTHSFIDKYLGAVFPKGTLPFISVWIGLPLSDKTKDNNEFFCSEINVHFYDECVSSIIEEQEEREDERKMEIGIGRKGDNKLFKFHDRKYSDLKYLFGLEGSIDHALYTPGDFDSEKTPNSIIFENKTITITNNPGDPTSLLYQSLIVAVFFLILFMMLLNKR